MTNIYLTKSALQRKKRNAAICMEFQSIISQNPEASVMIVRERLAERYNMSASSIANIVSNHGKNSAHRQKR